MEDKTRILIVEDDMIIAANISLQLTNLGYEVTGIESRGEEAVVHAKLNPPDIILMDVNLKGTLDGIDTTKTIQRRQDIPIIYLTANNDEATFLKARETHPRAFLSKPFNKLNFQRTIALVAEELKESRKINPNSELHLQVLEDRIFVRHNGRMEKLILEDILYIEADRNYCNIVTLNNNYLLTTTLKAMEEKLPGFRFLRVHRSYIVNISKLDVVADGYLEVNRKVIPLGKSHKELLFSRLQTI